MWLSNGRRIVNNAFRASKLHLATRIHTFHFHSLLPEFFCRPDGPRAAGYSVRTFLPRNEDLRTCVSFELITRPQILDKTDYILIALIKL